MTRICPAKESRPAGPLSALRRAHVARQRPGSQWPLSAWPVLNRLGEEKTEPVPMSCRPGRATDVAARA
jgi:hypothetical protein